MATKAKSKPVRKTRSATTKPKPAVRRKTTKRVSNDGPKLFGVVDVKSARMTYGERAVVLALAFTGLSVIFLFLIVYKTYWL